MPKLTFLNPLGGKSKGPMCVEAKPGQSILDVAEDCGARVGHACGGNLACSTCHVYVQEGIDSLPEAIRTPSPISRLGSMNTPVPILTRFPIRTLPDAMHPGPVDISDASTQ